MPSPFQFRFDSLLQIRKQHRDEAARVHAGIQQQFRHLSGEISQLNQDRSLQQEQHAASRLGRVRIVSLQSYDAADEATRRKLGELVGRQQGLSRELERTNQDLLVAEQEVKKLEKLYEREHAAFILQQNRTDIQRADDEHAAHRAAIFR